MVYGVMKGPIRRPKAKQSNPRLYEYALQDVPVYVMPEFVRQNRLDLFWRVIIEQRVRKNNAARHPQAGQGGIGLLGFFGKLPAINTAHPRARALAQNHQPSAQLLVVERFKLVE